MRQLTLTAKKNKFSLFEVVEINDERWIVVTLEHDGYKNTYTLQPLREFIARTHAIDDTSRMTIADYLDHLEEDFHVQRKEDETDATVQ